MEKYIPLYKISDTRKKVIKFSFEYIKGYYSIPRGIYLKIQPMTLNYTTIEGEEYVTESYQHGTGYSLLVRPLSRISIKQIKEVGDKLFPECENIVRLFQEGKTDEIKQLVTTLTA